MGVPVLIREAVRGTQVSCRAVTGSSSTKVLTHTDLPLVDAVEIHNRSDVLVDMSGWVISDSR